MTLIVFYLFFSISNCVFFLFYFLFRLIFLFFCFKFHFFFLFFLFFCLCFYYIFFISYFCVTFSFFNVAFNSYSHVMFSSVMIEISCSIRFISSTIFSFLYASLDLTTRFLLSLILR